MAATSVKYSRYHTIVALDLILKTHSEYLRMLKHVIFANIYAYYGLESEILDHSMTYCCAAIVSK